MFWMKDFKIRRKKRSIRGFALLLCFALCLENASLTAWAAETEVAVEGTLLEDGREENDGEEFDQENGDSDEEQDEEPRQESGDPCDEQEGEPRQEEESGQEEEQEKESEQVHSSFGGEPEENDPAEDVAEEPEQISGNSLDTISENTLETISENSLDGERQILLKKAEEAFDALLSEKNLMALLYHADSYDVRSHADSDSAAVATLEIGQTLYIWGIAITEDDVWYRVQYWLDGAEGTGYVQSYYLAYSDEDWFAWEEEYLFPILALGEEEYESTAYGMAALAMVSLYALDTSDISAFPWSYQSALRSLKNAHPNWVFVPMKTGLDFDASVSKEMGAKSLIQKTTNNSSKGWVGSACPSESGWYYATRPAVAYYMDPRNFLTETYIFQFEQLTFNSSYHTESAVQSFLNGTFMKGTLPDDSAKRTYARAFYEIGKSRKLSPIHLASRVYQEQGQGASGLISGTYAGYEGYYNFFNVGVNGSSTAEKIKKGLEYAKSKGWNTRYKSLEGGAATIGNNYILKYQDTIYLEKFNVDKNSPYGAYNHQYMQNIQAPASESSSTKKMYANAGSLNSAFVFKIPVYANMPEEAPLQSISLDKTEIRLRRPDTVAEGTTGFDSAEKEENTDTVVLQVSFAPVETTSDKSITWTSSNTKVATVKADPEDSSRAVVQAVTQGSATITAKASKAGNKTAACKVSVSAPIYRLTLTNRNAQETDPEGQTTLFVGQSINLTAEYWPKDTTSDTQIVWSSSDKAVAVVTNGKVTAVGGDPKKNTAVITAKVAGCEASYKVILENCSVTFMKEKADRQGWEKLGNPETVLYGDTLSEETIRAKEELLGAGTEERLFIGWYTGEDGTGSRFDENTPIHEKNVTLYPCYAEQGKGFYVLPIGDRTYTGSAIKPVVQVYDSVSYENGDRDLIELVLNRDYTVTYQNNKNVNLEGKPVPTITVKGKGNYIGTQKVTFRIVPKVLTDTDIIANDINVAYSGKVIKSLPTVYRNGKKLVKNMDYTVAYPLTGKGAYQTAGVYPIVITGKGGYAGRITVYENVTKAVLLNKVSVAAIPKQVYSNGRMEQEGGIRPAALKVTYKKQTLVEGEDYTVSYSADQSIGKATATLSAVEGSGYIGSKSVTYQIVGTSITKAKVTGLVNKEYTGTESDMYQSEYALTIGETILEESLDGGITGDYTVSYQKTNKVGTATIIFKGINEYSGQLKKTYRILPYAFKQEQIGIGEDITLSYYTQDDPEPRELSDINEIIAPYVKGGTKPTVLASFHGQALTPGKDYSISYKNNNALTTENMAAKKLPVITITGKGNFKGKLTGAFTITDGRMNEKVTMTAKDIVYRKKKGAYKTTAVLRDVSGKTLDAGRDYDKNLEYTYEEDAEVGLLSGETVSRNAGDMVEAEDIPVAGTTIRVTARGKGAYQGENDGECSAVYRIVAADLAKVKVKVKTKDYRNGREVLLTEEDMTLTISGTEEPLICGTDYEIMESTYRNNTKKGKAMVTLRGIGNYGGEKTIAYTIGAKKLWWQ